MQLTGKQITAENIIIGYDPEKAVQQQGVDIRVKKIYKFRGAESGAILKDRTVLPTGIEELPTGTYFKEGGKYTGWFLAPGYYEVQFMEGCSIAPNRVLHLKSRSSLVRCGAQICAGQFDAGFHTDSIGCFIDVKHPLLIEEGARICQAYVFDSETVENLYRGQWQADKQRSPESKE